MSREISYYKHLYREQTQAIKDAIAEIENNIEQTPYNRNDYSSGKVDGMEYVLMIIREHTGVSE